MSQSLSLKNTHRFGPFCPTLCPNVAADLVCYESQQGVGGSGSALPLIPNPPDGAQPTEPRCPVLHAKSAQLQMSGMSAAKLHVMSWVSHFNAATLAQSDARWRRLSRGAPAVERARVRLTQTRVERLTTECVVHLSMEVLLN